MCRVHHVCNKETATAVFLMTQLQRPLLVEGPPESAKPSSPRCWRRQRLTSSYACSAMEGLDEAKALYEWEYSKQLLYVQMLKDKFGTLLAATTSLNEAVSLLQRHTSAFFSQDFLLPRPLLQAILFPTPPCC